MNFLDRVREELARVSAENRDRARYTRIQRGVWASRVRRTKPASTRKTYCPYQREVLCRLAREDPRPPIAPGLPAVYPTKYEAIEAVCAYAKHELRVDWHQTGGNTTCLLCTECGQCVCRISAENPGRRKPAYIYVFSQP